MWPLSSLASCRFHLGHALSDALLEVQDISYLKMRNKPATSLDPKDLIKDLIIQAYMTKLEQQEITRFNFVYDLSRKFLPPKIKK